MFGKSIRLEPKLLLFKLLFPSDFFYQFSLLQKTVFHASNFVVVFQSKYIIYFNENIVCFLYFISE